MPTKYQAVADALRAHIQAGKYAGAAVLPSEFAIAQEYQVSRQTVRQALSLLARDGLIETKRGSDVMDSYKGEGVRKTAFTFPVYDATLLSFVKTARETRFVTRNYQYVYSRRRIKDTEQEKMELKNATLRDMELISGIFSRYILGGMTKSVLWAQGVENGIFLEVLYRLREILEINDLS